MQEIEIIIKRGLLDNRLRQLIINPEFIKFEDKNLINDSFTLFEKETIKDFRYGVKWINGAYFTFGRDYQIYIRNVDNKILKINFKSYFGLKKQEAHNKYVKIVNALWDFYFSAISDVYLNRFLKDESFNIEHLLITKDALIINKIGVLKSNKMEILWENVRTKNYHTYFAIYSIEDPVKINIGYKYLDEWNTGVIYSVVKTILNYKKIETLE